MTDSTPPSPNDHPDAEPFPNEQSAEPPQPGDASQFTADDASPLPDNTQPMPEDAPPLPVDAPPLPAGVLQPMPLDAIPVMSYATPDMDRDQSLSIARRMRSLIQVFALYAPVFFMFLIFPFSKISPQATPGFYQFMLFVNFAHMLLLIALPVLVGLLSYKISRQGVMIVSTILAIIPLVNFVVVLIIHNRAAAKLRSEGYEVGLLGPNLKQFKQ